VIRDRWALMKIALRPLLNFGEAYSDGRIVVEGSLSDLLAAAYRHFPPTKERGWVQRLVSRIRELPASNTLRGSRLHIHHHYDIGDDFYQLWLDREMLYTCAYYPTPEATLEEAQQAKMDYVCRKLRLRPGETVVEAGCGWGALARYMARNYGVRVKAYNISHAQIAYARRQAAEQGLEGRVEFIEDDYRTIAGRYDVFVSVGMLEHVGADHYRELGQVIDRCLDERGRGLIHSIGQVHPGSHVNPWIRRRIFPGAYPPALSEMVRLIEAAGFSVLDAENLRLHYAKTLEHWLGRFEASVDRVAEMFDDRFVRMWRLYLTGSMHSFLAGALHLFQIVFARPQCNDIPWTRAALYANSTTAG
jgi:cyclopropane-fatty-acyl-phospholipid synthase